MLHELGRRAYATAMAHGFHEHQVTWTRNDTFLNGVIDARHVLSWLMLITSEVAEACEEVRSGTKEAFASELADIIIRTVDCAYALGIDLDFAVDRKMARNEQRPYKHGGKRV